MHSTNAYIDYVIYICINFLTFEDHNMRTSPFIQITLFIHFCSAHKEERQEITSRYLNKTYRVTDGK